MGAFDLEEKFALHVQNTNYHILNENQQEFFKKIYKKYHFSFQQLKQLIDFEIDFVMWQEKNIEAIFKEFDDKKQVFNHVKKIWQELKNTPHSYKNFKFSKQNTKKYETFSFKSDKLALGSCPVASENTRCCNLLTLDAVNSCGFDCSYCSIQSFYKEDKIGYDENFAKNLKNLKLDKNKTYHIGTGQSSDSLMWGNKNNILDALVLFAKENENVILEFKTKSNNIKYLLQNNLPKNIIVTWSLNTNTIIENEEHLTASLDERIACAKALVDKGVLVGFHFHPMVVYENYMDEYKEVFTKLLTTFDKKDVALVSFGTLTFIKPVINKLRKRNFHSKILQMPFTDANKKFSYPYEIKKQMFSYAYECLSPWHDEVYFYMCMEDKRLWMDAFKYEYKNNDEMENAMKKAYFDKINRKKFESTNNR